MSATSDSLLHYVDATLLQRALEAPGPMKDGKSWVAVAILKRVLYVIADKVAEVMWYYSLDDVSVDVSRHRTKTIRRMKLVLGMAASRRNSALYVLPAAQGVWKIEPENNFKVTRRLIKGNFAHLSVSVDGTLVLVGRSDDIKLYEYRMDGTKMAEHDLKKWDSRITKPLSALRLKDGKFLLSYLVQRQTGRVCLYDAADDECIVYELEEARWPHDVAYDEGHSRFYVTSAGHGVRNSGKLLVLDENMKSQCLLVSDNGLNAVPMHHPYRLVYDEETMMLAIGMESLNAVQLYRIDG